MATAEMALVRSHTSESDCDTEQTDDETSIQHSFMHETATSPTFTSLGSKPPTLEKQPYLHMNNHFMRVRGAQGTRN